MAYPYSEGVRVIALMDITEQDFPIEGDFHTHARKGDIGKVIHVGRGLIPTVLWARTQTATIVGSDEIEAEDRKRDD